jgi:O-antigen ligase
MNGMMLGVLFPLVAAELAPVLSLPVVMAVVLSRSSMAFGALLVSALSWAWLCRRGWIRWISEEHVILVAAMAVSTVIADLWFDPSILSTNGRALIWQQAMAFWWSDASWMFGFGTGTAAELIPRLQSDVGGWGQTVFITLHNDWLQILWEHGLVGLALAAWVFIRALRKCRASPALCASVLALGLSACGNWPLRSGGFGSVSLLLILAALASGSRPPTREAAP